MPRRVTMDFETRSPVNIKAAGAHVYARHPETVILCLYYSFDGGEPRAWIPGVPFPAELAAAAKDPAVEDPAVAGPAVAGPVAEATPIITLTNTNTVGGTIPAATTGDIALLPTWQLSVLTSQPGRGNRPPSWSPVPPTTMLAGSTTSSRAADISSSHRRPGRLSTPCQRVRR